MNERIEQLAEQCVTRKFYVDHASEEFDYKKFAELIVAECAETVEVYIHESPYNGLYERGYNDGRNASALLIKQHFGVEE